MVVEVEEELNRVQRSHKHVVVCWMSFYDAFDGTQQPTIQWTVKLKLQ